MGADTNGVRPECRHHCRRSRDGDHRRIQCVDARRLLEIEAGMKTALYVVALSLGAAAIAHAQSIDGDWQGTLPANGSMVRVVLHVKADDRGGLTASLDSPDQGATGIRVASVSVANATLKFDVPAAGAAFEGKIDSAAERIVGTWSQGGGSTSLTFARPPAASDKARVRKPSEIDGDWEGALNVGGTILRLVLHVVTYEDGMSATLDSPDQNARDIPVTSITRTGAIVQFELRQLQGSYRGTLDAARTTLDGDWSQAGNSLPLIFKRR